MEFNTSSTLIPLLFFLLFLFTFLKCLLTSKSTATSSLYSHLPGPKPLPLIGSLHLMLRAATPHHLFRHLAAEHGPLMHLQLGELHFLIVSSVAFAAQVVKTHDATFANRPPGLVPETLLYSLFDIVFSPCGEHWRRLRRICMQGLLSARPVRSFRGIREEENLNLCREIASCEGLVVNLSEKIYLATYDVVAGAAVKAKTEEREMMIAVVVESLRLGSGFMLADLFPSVKFLPLITGAWFKIRSGARWHHRAA